MNTNNINVEFNNKNIAEKLEVLLKSLKREEVKELISTYYSYVAQQHVNDKKYEEISKLEGLVDLYNLL